jgi:sulfoacetaldehyde dehydrogenase
MAGISLPEGKRFFIVPETGFGPDHPFSGEKLSVVMALYRAKDIDEAIALTNAIQAYQGRGHSCGIYSTSDDNIMKLALGTYTSRVMVNQPQAASNSGNLWNGMPQTFSLGCGSWGGNATNNNISWRDLVNITWVSKPLAQTKQIPSDEDLFGRDVIEAVSGAGAAAVVAEPEPEPASGPRAQLAAGWCRAKGLAAKLLRRKGLGVSRIPPPLKGGEERGG